MTQYKVDSIQRIGTDTIVFSGPTITKAKFQKAIVTKKSPSRLNRYILPSCWNVYSHSFYPQYSGQEWIYFGVERIYHQPKSDCGKMQE